MLLQVCLLAMQSFGVDAASACVLPVSTCVFAGSLTEKHVYRYTLGEVKAELLEAMGLDTEKEGSSMQFLRRGYKTTTWWEDDEGQEESDAWRT